MNPVRWAATLALIALAVVGAVWWLYAWLLPDTPSTPEQATPQQQAEPTDVLFPVTPAQRVAWDELLRNDPEPTDRPEQSELSQFERVAWVDICRHYGEVPESAEGQS